MLTSNQTKQEASERDYDKELNEVFSEALKKIDPKILRALALVQKMNTTIDDKLQITVSGSGTSL